MDRTLAYRSVRVSRTLSQDRESAVALRKRIHDDAEDLLDSFGRLMVRDAELKHIHDQRNGRGTRGCSLCEESRYLPMMYDNGESPVYFRVTSKESKDSWTHEGVTTEKRVTVRRKIIRY